MFYIVLNAFLAFYEVAILRITFAGNSFCIKIAVCVSATLLKELCHRQFFRNFPKFFTLATFQSNE